MRQYWKPSNMLYPVPAVLVTCADEQGRANVMTAAWAGTVCSDPVMLSVSIRKERYSHDIIERTGEFAVCLTTDRMAYVTDYMGVKSGRDMDKFSLEGDLKLTAISSQSIKAPSIAESPVCLECRVKQVLELGSHDMFIGEVIGTNIDDAYLNEEGVFELEKAGLLAYVHGRYFSLGEILGTFGYSVRKKKIKVR